MWSKKIKKTIDKTLNLCYIILMINDDNWNEQDAATLRLLDLVCEGVTVPTDDEVDETLDMQSS